MTTLKGQPLDRAAIESLLKRRFFYAPTAEIYGSIAGFFDFGPPGCQLQANIVETWRKHFILEENMLEVDCPMITPHAVLKSSGHVERFCDYVAKDSYNGKIRRADHVIKEVLETRLKGNMEVRGETSNDIAAAPTKKQPEGKVTAEVLRHGASISSSKRIC